MARKTKEDSARTKELILDSSESVFYEQGITKATIADIATHAGLSRGAVYGHFKNKIEIALTMCERALRQPDLFAKRGEYKSPLKFLRALYLELLPGHIGANSLQRVLEILYCKCEESSENKPILDLQGKWEILCHEETKSIIQQAINAKELPANLGMEVSAIYLGALMKGLCTQIVNTLPPHKPLLSHAEQILDTGIDALKFSEHVRIKQ